MEFVFNSDGITGEVIPEINNSIIDLKEAQNILSSISIPGGFLCAGEVRSLPGKIEQIIKKCNETKSWSENAVSRFRYAEMSNFSITGQIWEKIKTNFASTGNVLASAGKGLLHFGEFLVDGVALGKAFVKTPILAMRDIIFKETGKEEMWEDTKSFVANEYVENAFKKFYEDTSVGKWLDENAGEGLKHDGVACKISEGIGFISGIGLTIWASLAIAEAIAGTAASAGTTAISTVSYSEFPALIEEVKGIGAATTSIGSYFNIPTLLATLAINGRHAEKALGKLEQDLKDSPTQDEDTREEDQRIQLIRDILPKDWRTLEDGLRAVALGIISIEDLERIQWLSDGKSAIDMIKEFTPTQEDLKDSDIDKEETLPTTPIDKENNNNTNYKPSIPPKIDEIESLPTTPTDGENNNDINHKPSIPQKIETIISQMKQFFAEHPEYNIDEKQIEEIGEKLVVCKDEAEFKSWYQKCGGQDDNLPMFFYSATYDKIFFQCSNDIETIIHELNHMLTESDIQLGTINRGINEALTESLALKITGTDENKNSEYYWNVRAMNEIVDLLENAGYKDIDAISYYNKDKTDIMANTLNTIVGDNEFYDELVKNMSIADGCENITDFYKVKEAQIITISLIDLLKDKIGYQKAKLENKDLITELIDKFEKNIPEDESEKNDLVEAFRSYLDFAVDSIKNSNSKFVRKDFNSVSSVLTTIANEFYDMDIMVKKQNLLEDKNLEEIQTISNKVFELARRKLAGETIDETLDSTAEIEKMNELLKEVQEYNSERANELVSETMLDLKFLNEDKPDALSLRIYHFINNK